MQMFTLHMEDGTTKTGVVMESMGTVMVDNIGTYRFNTRDIKSLGNFLVLFLRKKHINVNTVIIDQVEYHYTPKDEVLLDEIPFMYLQDRLVPLTHPLSGSDLDGLTLNDVLGAKIYTFRKFSNNAIISSILNYNEVEPKIVLRMKLTSRINSLLGNEGLRVPFDTHWEMYAKNKFHELSAPRKGSIHIPPEATFQHFLDTYATIEKELKHARNI